MPDEKPNKYEPVANAPIPTYEEAIGSSSSSPPPRSPALINEPSHPAERQGLLSADSGRTPVPTRRVGYRPPPTEDGQSIHGEDEDDETGTFLGQQDGEGRREQRQRRESQDSEEEEVRREMEEMEYDEQPPPSPRSAWGKRIASLSSLPWLAKLKFKPRWPTLTADMCIILGRCFAVLVIMAVVYLLTLSSVFNDAATQMAGQMFAPEDVRNHVQGQVSAQQIGDYLKIITKTDHLAGTEGDYALAKYIKDLFEEQGLVDVHMEEFKVYLNYPKADGRRVELINTDGSARWKAKVDENPVYKDPPRQQTPVFHGLSKTGDVKGPLIYVNYGARKDFKVLFDSVIQTKGAIALMRHGGSQEDLALKIKVAEEAGFVGCIIYNDPADDGFRKGQVAPVGPYLPGDAVARGSVGISNWVIGDVLTPGFASTADAKRIPKENSKALVKIPSISISSEDAATLLQAIGGIEHIVPDGWAGGLEGVEYWIGNLSSPVVHLVNDQDEVEQQPIWNVVGKIRGVEQTEKSVIIGNHRDAWVYGASDPGSGTAVMMEMVRVFGELMARGWRPLRTIEFVSWDAGAYNRIGSTEYVENKIEKLRADGYAYINLDVAVTGNEFHAAGSPVFKKVLLRALDRTSDEAQNGTVRALWDQRRAKLEGLGTGSDYVAFQDIAGTSSIDIGFRGPSYPAHSAYDNLEVASTVIDPGYQYHAKLTQIASLILLEFADKLVAPFDMSAYAGAVLQWIMGLERWVENKGVNKAGQPKWDINPLREAGLQFANDARIFEKWETEWDTIVLGGAGFETSVLAAHRKSHNNRMANFETHLLDLEAGGGVSLPSFPYVEFLRMHCQRQNFTAY